MITAINYADKRWAKAQRLNFFTATHYGQADTVIEYSDMVYDNPRFKSLIGKYHAHDFVNPESIGNGYWVWKPFIIL